ncbi:MAG: hypothetical protein PF961_09695 [Planctomycetota bacterium]|jgi:hypothetical protein|nr:hypothetical protein [Planctomycetota bacterium]
MFARLLRRLLAFFQRLARRNAFLAAVLAGVIATLLAILAPPPPPAPTPAVAGAWTLELDGAAALYCVLDDLGGVETASNFFNAGGSYQVAPGGDFTMSWNEAGGSPIQFAGTFVDDTQGTFSQPQSGELHRVPDRAAMAGLWYASFTRSLGVGVTEQRGGTFSVDASGAVVASSGDLTFTGGHIFINDGGVVMHGVTGASDAWVELAAVGSGDTQYVTGDLTLDTALGVDGSFVFSRQPMITTAAVAGPWMFRVGGAPELYAVLDGSGGVTTASNFFNAGGQYSVAAGGDFIMSIAESGAGSIDIIGNFTSDDAGDFTQPLAGTLERIADPSAMAGLWYATWRRTVDANEVYSGSFTVDATGVITGSSGPLALTGGRIYLSNGGVVMHATTSVAGPWGEIGCGGTGTNQEVNGALNLDTSNSSDGTFTLTRTLAITTASVAGPWLLQLNGQAEQFVIFDGTGGLQASNFFGTGGSYSVGPGGTLTMEWTYAPSGAFVLNGAFTSPTNGSLSNIPNATLVKVADPAALAGTWGGELQRFTQSGGTRALTITVDATGAFTGTLIGPPASNVFPTQGYAFFEGGQVVLHGTTGSPDQWSELGAWGGGDASSLSGDFSVDSSFEDDGDFTLSNPPPLTN